MSWLEGSPKHQGSKAKPAPGSSARGLWSSSTTRTYGSSRRPTSSLRGSAASGPKAGGLFRGHTPAGGAGGGQYGLTRVGLSSAYDEDPKSPLGDDSLASRASPELDSSPIVLTSFAKRGLDLDLESPGDSAAAAAAAPSDPKAAGRKAKKTTARARKGASRSRAARSSSADPTPKGEAGTPAMEEVDAPAPAPKRKVPAARKTRAARRAGAGGAGGASDSAVISEISGTGQEEGVVAEGGRPRASSSSQQSVRRERSPTRRGAGRPERWADRGGGGESAGRGPSSPLSSPLRPITNYTSEGDRPPRTKAKVAGAKTCATAAGGGENYSSNGGGGDGSSKSSSSEEEEEWRDDGMDFTRSASLNVGNGNGFSVEEENDSELDDAVIDATGDDSDDLDDVVIDLTSSSTDVIPRPKPPCPTTTTAGSAPAVASSTSSILKRAAPDPTDLKAHASAPALAMTTSPALVGLSRRPRREAQRVTHGEKRAPALAQASSVEDLARGGWGDDSPPARLSRSLSLSQTSAPSAWHGAAAAAAAAAGCAKVTRSSHRRRSRANSTSSPLPVLEMSASMPTGGIGLSDATAVAREDFTARSFGSVASLRHRRRGSLGGGSGGGGDGIKHARRKSSCEVSSGSNAPLSRSHRMPSFNHGNSLRNPGRPVSLPQGIMERGSRRGGEEIPGEALSIGGDAGFGWVLRSPGAPPDDRRRSKSFAGGARPSATHARSDSNPVRSSGGGAAQYPPGLAGAASVDMYGLSGEWARRDSGEQESGMFVAGDKDEEMAPAQTPQASPSDTGDSAAMRRAHGLSSVARRMDRLEIRSPAVETHAAQAQLEIMADSTGDNPGHGHSIPEATTSLGGSDGTPSRPRISSLPAHYTPVGNSNVARNERSRLSGAGGSPTECFRDYLSGLHGKEEEEDDEELLGEAKHEGKAPKTPSAVATPSAPASHSPPGVTCTRSTALGLPSPILAGLFGDADNSHALQTDASFTPRAGSVASGGSSGAAVDGAPGGSGGASGEGEAVGGEGGVGATGRGASLARKGAKLGLGAKAKTLPARGTRASPEGGFLIRRKTLGNAPSSSSFASSTSWPKAYAGQGREDDTAAEPPKLERLSSGSRSSSLYLSCLSSGEAVQSPGEGQQAEVAPHQQQRSISSPLSVPLMVKEFDTPSASGSSACVQRARAAAAYNEGAAGVSGTDKQGLDATDSRSTTDPTSAGRDKDRDRDSRYRSPALGAPAAASSGMSDRGGNRRTSTESVGATTSRTQFETPQPETKLKWGSQPQYGDWGISQRASAGSLRHLAGRLRAFVDRATGRRASGGRDSDGGGGGGDLPMSMASPVMHGSASTAETPLEGVTTPLPDLPDLPLLPPPQATPGSSKGGGAGDSGSLLAYGNSLGAVSEREGGRSGAGVKGGETEDGDGDGDGYFGGIAGSEGLEETDVCAEEREGLGAAEMQALWDPSVFGDDGLRRRDGSVGVGRGRRGRDRLSSLMMTEGQREKQRRRQSKAKRRRVSISIKSRRTSSSVGLTSRLAGLSLLEVAEASSPGPGKMEPRSRLSPYPKAAAFAGGAISEGEEEDEDDEQREEEDKDSSMLQAVPTPKPTQGQRSWSSQGLASPMSVERPAWPNQERDRDRPREDGRAETPAKVREDLEKSLTELNNLSLSICNSEENDSPAKHERQQQQQQRPSKTDDTSYDSGSAGADILAGLDSSSSSPVAIATTKASSLPTLGLDCGGVADTVLRIGDTTGPPAVVSTESALEALRRPGVMAKALRMLSVDELLGDVPLVCAAWRKASVYAFAEVASDMTAGAEDKGRAAGGGRALRGRRAGKVKAPAPVASRSVWSEEKLVGTFPWGGFLSEGACKQVHKVWNAATGQMEALSVMDRKELEEDEEVVSREVRVSILASSLVQRRISPNFVQTFGLFRSTVPLHPELFGTKEEKYPCGRSPGIIRHRPRVPNPSVGGVSQGRGVGRSNPHASASSGSDLRYQYIGMELCEHGDAEVFIKTQRDGLLPTVEAQGFLFQMAFALYAGRAELSLRHFDVKLLNFFVSDASRLVGGGGQCGGGGGDVEEGGPVTLRYGVGGDVVELCLPQDRAYLVKLADFGTADVDPLTVGNPVEACHFSTLENTPIEQLCCGNKAVQGYASDTFALALAAFHLFTGEAPYEEIMEEVECPDELYDALVQTWDQNPQYVDVCDIIINDGSDEEEDDDVGDDDDTQDPTLLHTFYRYLVLFGVPDRDRLEEAYGTDNPVWKAVGPLLGWKQPRRGRGGRATAASATASKKFCRQLDRDR
ncbi:conserved unknown protein (Partial), partial [Ectocarpus siliculosus]